MPLPYHRQTSTSFMSVLAAEKFSYYNFLENFSYYNFPIIIFLLKTLLVYSTYSNYIFEIASFDQSLSRTQFLRICNLCCPPLTGKKRAALN